MLARNKPHPAAWGMVWLIFVWFVGLRHQVGGDWVNYLRITEVINLLPLSDALRVQEPIFSLLTWVSAKLGFGVYGVNLIGAAIAGAGLFAYCRKQFSPWMALATALPFLVIVAMMSANRQGMAIGIVLYVMSRWQSLGILKRSFGIALAAMFHTSAAILMVLSVIDLNISAWRKAALLMLVSVAAILILSSSDAAFNRYTQIYIQSQPEGVYSSGAVFHLLLNAVPGAIILLFRRRWMALVEDWRLIQQLSIISIALLPFVTLFSVAVGRMSLYLFPVSIAFISNLQRLASSSDFRALIRMLTIFILAVILWAWLEFANSAVTYLPYKNVLLIYPDQMALPR